MTEHEAVAVAESKYGVKFKKVTAHEYRSMDGCPWCGDGGKGYRSDRFRLILNGSSGPRVWCRQCDNYEFLDGDSRIDAVEARLAAIERRQEEHDRRIAVIEQMKRTTDHIAYYQNMINNRYDAIEYWISEGIKQPTIDKYMLGFCNSCPTAPYSSSYTIPVMYSGEPYNIRHRLTNPNGSGKYRPHMVGLPVMLFNADDLKSSSDYILILEGEKKSMVVGQETKMPNVAIMGMQSFNNGWVSKFDNFKSVYIILDPDADNRAVDIAKMFGKKGIVVTLPTKADEFFSIFGGRVADFKDYMSWGRTIA